MDITLFEKRCKSLKILNLGCGSKTSAHHSVENIDWSILLRIRTNRVLRSFAGILLNGDRLKRFHSLPNNIRVHDLQKGIPYRTGSVDAIYHSHVLEHIDRDNVPIFIRECARVLKPGGILRVVVPNFEIVCRKYLSHTELCEKAETEIAKHDSYLGSLLSQSVQREAYGTSQQKPIRRLIENILLGDARVRGQTHQWMYDRFNLSSLLMQNGFSKTVIQKYNNSFIPQWDALALDMDDQNNEYKPESLYMEAVK